MIPISSYKPGSKPVKTSDTKPIGEHISITGTVERIRFSSEENGFSIIVTDCIGYGEVILQGSIPSPVEGETFTAEGSWISTNWGTQVKVTSYSPKPPTTIDGIVTYLGSGIIKGIRGGYAKRIVSTFGLDALDIIQNNPERLLEVKGITEDRLNKIRKSWNSLATTRELMLFMSEHNIPLTNANRIQSALGKDAVDIIRKNPYVLATNVTGIGFMRADKIAIALGIKEDSPFRIDAGVIYVLETNEMNGSTCMDVDKLASESMNLLNVPIHEITDAITRLKSEDSPVWIRIELRDGVNLVSIGRTLKTEEHIATEIKRLLKNVSPVEIDGVIDTPAFSNLSETQRLAAGSVLNTGVTVITGGPGTGKSTTIKAILEIVEKYLPGCTYMCAPTGRAAKRMAEVCGSQASTIHRLLEYNPEGGFTYNKHNKLNCSCVIVDEVSMVDVFLMNYLVQAIPDGARLILVGDQDQLPSVGPGKIMADIIESGIVPVHRFTSIFRQAAQSRIIQVAQRINTGVFPFIKESDDVRYDASYIPVNDAGDAVAVLTSLMKHEFDGIDLSAYNPIGDIQILTPMKTGDLGTHEINKRLQDVFIPSDTREPAIILQNRSFFIGDRVMQIRNNYNLGVFNGTIGIVTKINPDDRELEVRYDDGFIVYDMKDLSDLIHAYAITIHKSQGSEFPVVILLLTNIHHVMLQRRLLYTAATRARNRLIVLSTDSAIHRSISNISVVERNTSLLPALQRSFQA